MAKDKGCVAKIDLDEEVRGPAGGYAATPNRLLRGVQGPACSDIAKLVTDLVGAPAREENTSEYYARPQTLRQVRQKS